MSIFDRLISTLTGGAEVAAPTPAKAPTPEEQGQTRRFMGRDGVESKPADAAEAEKGLEGHATIWLHVQPTTQRLILASDIGVATGEELTPKMTADLQHFGWCEEVAYHAGYDQYWKMPSQEAILRTPSLYQIPTPLLSRMKVETRLVKQGEPRGFWMRVRIRTQEEVPVQHESPV